MITAYCMGFASMITAFDRHSNCVGFASMNIAGTCLRGYRLHEFIVGDQSVQGCRRGCYVRVGVGSAVSSRLLLSG